MEHGQAEQAGCAGWGEVEVGAGPVLVASGERGSEGALAGAEVGGVRAGGVTRSRFPQWRWGALGSPEARGR